MATQTRLSVNNLPFLTLPDPPITGEGVLDPLGLATIGERLADWIIPGMTARMNRPRFLTAIAVSAAVCEGLQEEIASDGKTPAYLVFEWLAVGGFARKAERSAVHRTPGIEKAIAGWRARAPMSAQAYLKAPTVFGFHGVYRRLARDVRILVDDILDENGSRLLKIWEREQGLEGFLESARSTHGATKHRQVLRSAVTEGLRNGYVEHSDGWQGWQFFVQYLAPSRIGRQESEFLRSLLLDENAGMRGEVFQLLEQTDNFAFVEGKIHEANVVRHLLPQASSNLAVRLHAIIAYEEFCGLLESGFEWLRWLSSRAGARALPRSEFASEPEVRHCAGLLRSRLRAVERALDAAPARVQSEFAELAQFFNSVTNAEEFLDALLGRHREVQKAKPPEGKQFWFAESDNGGVIVRPAYRLDERPEPRDWWPRPYRLGAIYSFCRDLKRE